VQSYSGWPIAGGAAKCYLDALLSSVRKNAEKRSAEDASARGREPTNTEAFPGMHYSPTIVIVIPRPLLPPPQPPPAAAAAATAATAMIVIEIVSVLVAVAVQNIQNYKRKLFSLLVLVLVLVRVLYRPSTEGLNQLSALAPISTTP
jgi:hypothetical protein